MSQQTGLVVVERSGKVSRTQVYVVNLGGTPRTESSMRYAVQLQAGSNAQHPPITVIAANPSLLFFCLLQNTVLPQVRLEFYRPDPSGTGEMQQFYTIVLTDAMMRSRGRRFVPESSTEKGGVAEEIEISFQKIAWEYGAATAAHNDPWSSQD